MKIAIATDWFAPRRGGVEAQLAQLAAGLAKRGHEVDVITTTPGPEDGEGFRARRLATTLLSGSGVALSPMALGAIKQELLRDYDVVHAHVSVVSPVGYAAAGIARILGLPTVVTFHSVLRHKRHLLRIANVVAGLSESAVVWTAVSELVASQVRAALVGANVSVLSNGVDVAFWKPSPGDVLQRRERHAVLVSTMRLHRKKRPRQLLTAFARAASRSRAPAVLRIVGDGPERSAVERDIRSLGLDFGNARVELLGWLPPNEVRAVYASADAFVLASTRESFGIAALEAAVAGLPVIAMAESGCREFLADRAPGLLCRDDAALTDCLAACVASPKAFARGTTPDSLDRYDWRAVLAEHERTYRVAMARAGAAAPAVA